MHDHQQGLDRDVCQTDNISEHLFFLNYLNYFQIEITITLMVFITQTTRYHFITFFIQKGTVRFVV